VSDLEAHAGEVYTAVPGEELFAADALYNSVTVGGWIDGGSR
jgi:hypothetical protein